MSAGRETQQVLGWARGKLLGGTALTALLSGTACVYRDLAPNGTATPYVVYSLLDSEDRTAVAGARGAVGIAFSVKAVIRSPDDALCGTIMAAADPLLHQASGSVSGLNIIECVRVREIGPYTETSDGVRYTHYGAEYHAWAENA